MKELQRSDPGFYEDESLHASAVEDFAESTRYVGFSFSEIFLSEQRPEIQKCIFSLFPSLRAERSAIFSLESLGRRLDHESYWNVGRLQRTPKNIDLGRGNLRTLQTLPGDVEHIDVTIETSATMPSIVLVTFHVTVLDSVTQTMSAYLGKTYRARPTFSGSFLKPRLSYHNPAIDRETRIDAYLDRLRSETIFALQRFLSGGYFTTTADQVPILELFEVKGLPETPDRSWLARTKSWRDAIGINFEYAGLGGGKAVIQPSRARLLSEARLPWRIFTSAPNNAQHPRDNRFKYQDRTMGSLSELTMLVTIAQYEETQEALLYRFRARMRRFSKIPILRSISLLFHASLFEQIIDSGERIERILKEAAQEFQFSGELTRLLDQRYQVNRAGESIDIEDGWFPRLIQRRLAVIRNGLASARQYVLDMLSVRNLVAILIVSTVTLCVSLGALLVSLLAIYRSE